VAVAPRAATTICSVIVTLKNKMEFYHLYNNYKGHCKEFLRKSESFREKIREA